jgi:hypothetical protein
MKNKIIKKIIISLIKTFKKRKPKPTFISRKIGYKSIFPVNQCKSENDCIEVYKGLINSK